MLRKINQTLEGVLILFAIVLVRILPLDFASMLGGAIARLAGPLSRGHKTARVNLEKAMPELSDHQRRQILRGMWDNIGRVMAEYPHLARPIMAKRITIEGCEYIDKIRDSAQPVVIVSGHFANWEITPLATSRCGLPTVIIYREANNPVAAWLSRKVRSSYTKGLHNKGRKGAIESIKALKEGYALTMLIDQRMNDGTPIPFFAQDAMTATAAARLAAKFQIPILAGRIVRKKGVHFHFLLEPPLYPSADVNPVETMKILNTLIERWVREHPAQWFWVHNRWGKMKH